MTGLAGKLDSIILIVWICIGVAIFIGALVALIVWYFFKVKKRTAVVSEDVDYSELDRRDSESYLKFDDITNSMIITDNYTRFLAAIKCTGSDFYSAPASEQVNVRNNYIGFINTIDEPIQYRQYAKDIELTNTIKMYEKARDKAQDELFYADQDYEKAMNYYNAIKDEVTITQEQLLQILDEIEKLQEKMRILEGRVTHLNDNIDYAEWVSGNTEPEIVETYIVEYYYQQSEFGPELSKDEIIKKASKELTIKVNGKIDALGSANVRAYRMDTEEIISMVRRHFRPISGDIYGSEKIQQSNFYEDITTTDKKSEFDMALEDMEEAEKLISKSAKSDTDQGKVSADKNSVQDSTETEKKLEPNDIEILRASIKKKRDNTVESPEDRKKDEIKRQRSMWLTLEPLTPDGED